MRKIALLTVPLVILGLVSLHAEEMDAGPMVADSPTVELKGNSTLTFGIDLNTNATGFSNSMETDLKVTLIPKATSDTGMNGMGDIYGWVELKDYKWEVTSADGSGATTAPSITTKLFVGPFSITTYNKPTIEVDYVDPKDDDKGDATDTEVMYGAGVDGGGLTLGYELDPIDLSVGIISENDWKDDGDSAPAHSACHVHEEGTNKVKDCPKDVKDDQNTKNRYAFLGTIGVDVGDSANVEMAVAYGHEYEKKPIGIGAKATFDLNDTIHPHVAFDGEIPEGGANIEWDVGSGLKWDLSDDDETYFETDLMMYVPREGQSTLGISATLKEGDEDKGALESLGTTLTLRLDDLTSATNDATWTAEVAAHYKVSGIKPFFDVSFSNKKDAKTGFKAGLELSMVEHLVTTLQYESTDILSGDDKGDVTAALKISY